MMGWCPNDGNECHHDGYCKDCEHNEEKGMNEEKYNRMKILLKAAFDILKKQKESPYVLNCLATTAIWDDAECDGYCLMEEIAEILEIDDES